MTDANHKNYDHLEALGVEVEDFGDDEFMNQILNGEMIKE